MLDLRTQLIEARIKLGLYRKIANTSKEYSAYLKMKKNGELLPEGIVKYPFQKTFIVSKILD